jgi:N-acetylglucosaminyldiphosphoundecaprenol N-acetyl-beta-D-mannosaminyltransferase
MESKINFLNTFINIMNKKDYLKIISSALHNNEKKVFFYLNTHSFYLLKKNEEFRECFNKADFITPDGFSIKWAVSFLYNTKIEKVSFNHNFLGDMREMFSEKQYRVYLLGGKAEQVTKAANNLINNPRGLNVAGFHHGYFNKNKDSKSIADKINAAQPDILLIGMGMPESVIWIIKNKELIDTKLIFTAGNLFDIIAGKKRLAPKFLYNTPFEWMFRLVQEPLKLLPRYFIAHPYFFYCIMKAKIFGYSKK